MLQPKISHRLNMGSKTRLGSYCTKRANNGVNLVTSRIINTRLARPIDNKQKAIAIFIVNKAQRNMYNSFRKLANADIEPVFVPDACTDELQLLDLSMHSRN